MKMNLFVTITLIFLGCFLLCAADKELVFSSVLFRHGDRTPTKALDKNAYAWKNGLGELTPLGMRQEYELGSYLRKRYVNEYKLIPKEFDVNLIYVRSSDVNRTLMSAESLLYGLYPLGTGPLLENGEAALLNRYQPIPIHTVDKTEDKLLQTNKIYEKLIKKLRHKYVYKTEVWKQKEETLKPFFEMWSEVSGLKIDKLKESKAFASDMFIRSLYNIPLPKEIETKEQREIILPLASWIHAQQNKPQIIGYLESRDFLSQLLKTINDSLTDISKYKLYLYSAHDTNILAVMSALGVPLDENPHYASYMAFEVYKTEEKYYIKIIYNNEDVKLPIDRKDDFYEVERFIKYYNKIDADMSKNLQLSEYKSKKHQ